MNAQRKFSTNAKRCNNLALFWYYWILCPCWQRTAVVLCNSNSGICGAGRHGDDRSL